MTPLQHLQWQCPTHEKKKHDFTYLLHFQYSYD